MEELRQRIVLLGLSYAILRMRVGLVKSLHAVNRALIVKLWWNFRISSSSLWGQFM